MPVDTANPQGGREPSEEEIREYTRQVRALPVERLVADSAFSLLSAAQAKLGRRDARLLIDLATVSVEHAREYLSADLTKQVDDVLGQLRLAQVRAEGQASSGQPEENDLDRAPSPPGAQGSPATGAAPQSPTSAPATSKLWIPGR